MATRSVGLGTMFGWVGSAVALFRKDIGSMVGASALMLVLAIAMALPIAVYFLLHAASIAYAMAGYSAGFWGAYALTIVLQLLLGPPLLVGWFRLCRGLELGAAVGAGELLKPFRDSETWFRSIRVALLSFALFVLAAAVFVAALWRVIADVMARIAEQQAAMLAGTTPPHPGLPAGFFFGYLAFILVFASLQLAMMLAYAEISARPTGAFPALRLGLAAVGKNLPKLLLFSIVVLIAFGVAMVCVVLALALVAWLLSMVHWLLAAAVAIAFYVALLLCLYPLMFAGSYLAWKDMLGDDGHSLVV